MIVSTIVAGRCSLSFDTIRWVMGGEEKKRNSTRLSLGAPAPCMIAAYALLLKDRFDACLALCLPDY